MAGMDFGAGREGEQFLADGAQELGVVAAGQIGAADGALEECVAGNDAVGFGNVEADASGGMAGGFEGTECVAAEGEDIAFGEWAFDGGEFDGWQAEEGGLVADGLVEGEFAGVHVDLDAEGGFGLGQGTNVVQVGVGDENGLDADVELVDGGKNDARFIAGIDEEGFAGVLVGQDAAILLEVKTHRDNLVNHTL